MMVLAQHHHSDLTVKGCQLASLWSSKKILCV